MSTRMTDAARRVAAVGIGALMLLMVVAPVGAQTLSQECENPDVGYTIAFPSGWYVNEHVEGGDVADVVACRFFSPEDFEVVPATGAANVAIAIGLQAGGPPAEFAGEPITVDGHAAFRGEEVTPAGADVPEGTRYYNYWIDLGDGTWLLASTSDGPTSVGHYDANRSTLDAMMDSLDFGSASLPDTAMAAPDR